MRWLGIICFLVLASGLAVAQNAGPSDAKSVADEMQALRDAVAQQQQLINQQQQQIDTLKKTLAEDGAGAPRVEDAALHSNTPVNATNANNVVQGDQKPKESPLSFRIGGTEFTPGGFVDFENVFRSTNTTNNISTSFQSIPFSNTVTGHLTEFRTTGQYSRYNLKITGKFGANDILGYIEGDFNGNNAANVYTTSNGNTGRLRLYWVDVKRGHWEYLGGQSWGLMTPNRVGLSPMPQDLLLPYNEDANIQVGTNYTRAGQFRVAWHPSDNFAWAVGMENPEQFSCATCFPANANFGTVQLPPQFNPTNNSNGTPNVAPDFVTKMAFDGNPGGRHMHFEVGGILTSARITFLPSVAGTTFQHATNVGGGVQGAFVVSMTKNFRLVGNGLWGPGVGRYNIGMGPQVIVKPTNFGGLCTTTGLGNLNTVNCGLALSPVHSSNGLLGLELQATPKTLFGAYYGVAYFQRNTYIDVTSPDVLAIPIACAPGFPFTTHPCGGYGGFRSSNTNNRAIQEATFDWTQTFWRSPQYGAVLLIMQYSYLTRAPWFVAAGAPKNAHLSMGWLSLRYVLP